MKTILLFVVILSILLFTCSCTCKKETQNLLEDVSTSLHNIYGYGDGVNIAVIDSGANSANVNIEHALDFSEEYNTIDSIDHGVPIINIISDEKYGLAPKATVYSLKVINKYGHASTQALYNALEWCLNNKIDLINMSLSFGIYSENIECIISELVDNGVIIVASINNFNKAIDYPSMYDGVICVGRTDSPELYAIDRRIIFEQEYLIRTVGSNGKEKDYAGNSFLTPVITGIVACLIGKKNLERSISNEEIITIVKAILSKSNVRIN